MATTPPRPGSDTPPEVERMMIELWRKATPEQKLQKVLSIGRMLNEFVLADLRQRYPEATERELQLRLAARSYDRDLMMKAFGWDPDVHGR
ncbi:MAG TPA: hypothetical protein VNO30_19420 [Kofleriaceae bacterium]|nr:hypothetical protein [Kofleriaceae bacterium]